MKTMFALALMAGFLVQGTGQAPASRAALESTGRKALALHGSLLPQAPPQVRAKITASAQALEAYLARCSRDCNLYGFCSKDLKARFKRLTDRQLHLLVALVYAETLGDMSQMDQLTLQDTLQEEQQFVQIISDIMKEQQDTLKAIIDNLR